MLTAWPFPLVLVADSLTWATWSVAVALLGARWPDDRLRTDGVVTRLRGPERRGRFYRRLGIRRWKRWLPDFGRFGGGRSKRPGRSRELERWRELEIDCRRAELVHWLTLIALPLTLVWSAGPMAVAMMVYAAAFNLPCIAVQRDTRRRLAELRQRPAVAG